MFGSKKVESCGVTFIAMPCNTAHLYFDALQAGINVPLMNMVNITLDAVPPSAKSIAILGTRPTIDSQIFQRHLIQRGLKPILHPHRQIKVDEMIIKVKATNDREGSLDLWRDLSLDLISEEVDTILFVCTDLNVIFKNTPTPFQIIDVSLCLAKSIANKWREQQGSNSH